VSNTTRLIVLVSALLSACAESPDDDAVPDHAPPVGECALPPIGDWVGSTNFGTHGGGSRFELRAQVTWTLEASAGCVDRYRPTGTLTYDVAGTGVWYSPETGPIEPADGELVIDRSTRPATFRLHGVTKFATTKTEVIDNQRVDRPAVIGGKWIDVTGSFDGPLIHASIRRIDPPLPFDTNEWSFAPVDAPPPPRTHRCVEEPVDRWVSHTRDVDAEAQVEWTRTSTIGCVDTFAPSGTVTALPRYNPACADMVFEPASMPVEQGTLRIDRSTAPPTFEIRGGRSWHAGETCRDAAGNTIGYGSTYAGGSWADFSGPYLGDGFSELTPMARDLGWQLAKRF
jgi:hypothetical protein